MGWNDLLSVDLSAVNDKKPRKSDKQYPAEDIKANALASAGLLADFVPVYGSGKAAKDEYDQGNYGMAALNGAGSLFDVATLGSGALLKGALLGMVKRGKDYDKIPSMLKEIDQAYKATGDVKKLRKVEAAVLDPDEMAAFNANRYASQPKLATGSLDYNGRHHYQSRADTPDGNGYAVDDLQAQLDSVTTGKLVPQVDRAGVAMKQTVKRDDGYGNTLTDKMSIMVSPDGKGELYSVIPDDGLKKGQKVRRSLLDSGDQAHPVSDGVRIESGEPLDINIAPQGLLGNDAPQRPLTEFEQRHLTAQKNAALPVEHGGLGLPVDNTAMDRAKAMGAVDAYHGTNKEITAFDVSKGGWKNPNGGGAREGGLGVWSSDNPDVANQFAAWADRNLGGGNVMPLKVMMDSPLDVEKYSDVKSIVDKHTQFARPDMGIRMMQDVVDTDAARKELIDSGYDSLRLMGTMTDSPDGVTKVNQFLSLKPENIRSRFAAFDPMRRHEADLLGNATPEFMSLLAGGGLLGLGGYSLMGEQ